MSRTDRVIGIVLGLVIGVAAVILFVFGGGASSIDDPSLDQPAGMERGTEPDQEPAPESTGGGE